LWLVIILLILLFLWLVSRVSNSAKVKSYRAQYQDKAADLKRAIGLQERRVLNIRAELDKIKLFNDSLIKKAERFLMWTKIIAMIIITGVGIVFYTLLNFGLLEASGAVLFVSSILFNAVTILRKNKLGDLELTLQILKEYFLAFQYKQENFAPETIGLIEARLTFEQGRLELLRKEYDKLKTIKD
jgi:hypothetical protein